MRNLLPQRWAIDLPNRLFNTPLVNMIATSTSYRKHTPKCTILPSQQPAPRPVRSATPARCLTYLNHGVLLFQFVGIHVPDFFCVGTPAQLRSFLGLVRTGVIKPRHKARVCFDLDRSLRIARSGSGADETASVRPVARIVRLLQVSALKCLFLTFVLVGRDLCRRNATTATK